MTFHWIPLGAKKQRSVERGAQASRDRWDSEELDIKLDMLLGAPEDLRDYQDCIRAARGKERK